MPNNRASLATGSVNSVLHKSDLRLWIKRLNLPQRVDLGAGVQTTHQPFVKTKARIMQQRKHETQLLGGQDAELRAILQGALDCIDGARIEPIGRQPRAGVGIEPCIARAVV